MFWSWCIDFLYSAFFLDSEKAAIRSLNSSFCLLLNNGKIYCLVRSRQTHFIQTSLSSISHSTNTCDSFHQERFENTSFVLLWSAADDWSHGSPTLSWFLCLVAAAPLILELMAFIGACCKSLLCSPPVLKAVSGPSRVFYTRHALFVLLSFRAWFRLSLVVSFSSLGLRYGQTSFCCRATSPNAALRQDNCSRL